MRHISFDQRIEQVGLSHERGFTIFNCANCLVIHEARFPGGGATCISLLSDSNIVAVSGDDSPVGFTTKNVMLWDRNTHQFLRVFEVESPITNLIFRADCLIVVHGRHISFFDCCDFTPIYDVDNPIPGNFCVSLVQSLVSNLVAIPSATGDCLNIVDYTDPNYVLGSIPVPFNKINFFAFDRRGDLLVIVTDEAKIIQLWDVQDLSLIATYKRGLRPAQVTNIAFDHLSSYFLMNTKRGTIHVFQIPTPAQRKNLSTKEIRSCFSYDIGKGSNFRCEFDVAGYQISGVSTNGVFIQLGINFTEGKLYPISN